MLSRSEVSFRIIANIMGFLLMVEGMFMLTGLSFALYYREETWYALLLSGLITLVTGLALWFFTRSSGSRSINKREGYVIVATTWVFISLFGTLPFMISGAIPSFTDAFFETMSGFTTTGATILTDIEVVPKSILFWRSLTHWIGGMGIIVLSVAILPFLGIGGMQLYLAEMPGVKKDKLHPRITHTAKRLWLIYVGLTLVQTIMLLFGGMDLFESLCHAFGTLATGGFSTRNASMAAFSPYIQYVTILFMILAGTNFTLHYLALHFRFRDVWKNEEFRKYLYLIAAATGLITIMLVLTDNWPAEEALRHTFFQVVSIVTTTGYITSDYLLWPGELWFILFMLMFVGGMAGSTGGGVKVVRQLLLVKNGVQELKRNIHPQGIIPVRLNHEAVPEEIIFKVMAFFQWYVVILLFGSLVMAMLGLDFQSALGATIATLGNIGPGMGQVGPVGNYAFIPDAGKWFLSFMMMMGRLELFTILIFFSKAFWNR